MLKRRVSAFSLLEMALVLSIIGVISAYAIPALLQARATARWRETDVKLESVIYALAGHVQTQRRLPCPANPSNTGSSAGEEEPGRITGILPYRTLGIQESDAKDGFRHWISYSVSQSLTIDTHNIAANSFAGWRGSRPSSAQQDDSHPICNIHTFATRLDVHDAQGQSMFNMSSRNDFIAFVLVSHGPSGSGAFDDAGQRKPATGDKLQNFGNTPFIDRPITKEYDDRVRWVSRNNLMAMYAKQPCKPIT